MRNIVSAVMVLLLCGCSVGPDYVRPDVKAPDQWNVEYKAAADLANTQWWKLFGDTVLDDLVETAVRGNLDLKSATAKVDQYLGVLDTTRSQYFPQISAGFEPGATNSGGRTTQSYQATVNATWELDLWGKIRRSSEAAQANIVGSEAGRRAVIMTVVSNVASGYITLRGMDRQLEIARDTEKAYAESLKLFQLRFKHGTVSGLELAQAESNYESARQAVPNYESLVRQQENMISLLLGRAPGPIPRGKTIDELVPPGIPAGLPSRLLERRPDIIQAEQNLIAANAEIGVAKAAYFPKISLTGALGVSSGDISKLFVPGAGIWSAGAQLAQPLFNFGQTAGQVKQAESQQQQAMYQYQQTILTAFREVEDALIKTTKGREQLEAQKRQVDSLSEYDRLARLQFEAGTSNYLQVLDADRSLFTGKLDKTKTHYDLLVSLISVYKAMGGGWVQEADKLQEPQKK
ncbi:MAG: efflux transporter outer membrane subunit [Geobacteraceae bacterium]|nr:efflux transporter outer membrane subunit [Geobacteraceae bacterium]